MKLIKISFIASVLLLSSACKEQSFITQSESKVLLKSKKMELYIPPLDSIPNEIIFKYSDYQKNNSPRRPVCGSKDVTVWQLDHYEAKPGKIFGIWPHDRWETSVSSLSDLRKKWGFNYILLQYSDGSKYNNFISAGYSITNIMVTLYDFEHANHEWVIDTYAGAYAFYVDEPAQTTPYRNFIISFAGMPNYINTHSPYSYFITGAYKPTYAFDGYVYSVDKVMFTSYKRWWEYPVGGVWFPWVPYPPFTSKDQRWNWSDYKNRYGYKAQSNWIGTHRDQSEYSDLLGKASNLGFSEIWLYSHENSSLSEISAYTSNAWTKGWLRRFERKYIYEYRCSYPDPCDCDPDIPDGWYLYKVWEMNDTREALN